MKTRVLGHTIQLDTQRNCWYCLHPLAGRVCAPTLCAMVNLISHLEG